MTSESFSPYLVEKFTTEFGDGYRLSPGDRKALAFFGNKNSSRERLESEFPQLQLIAIRQTHSDILIQSPYEGEAPEADAHWTRESNASVGIRTADCVPVLIFDLENSIAVSVHAGWRGVENEILVKSLREVSKQGFSKSKAVAFVGPHIALKSFEVGVDVAEKLKATFLKSAPGEEFPFYSERSVPNAMDESANSIIQRDGMTLKTYVDLDLIVRAQLRAAGIENDRQHWLPIDTVTSLEHESFRRDREKSGRQISFAALLK